MRKEQNFERFLTNHFGITLPADVAIFFDKGIRIGARSLLKTKSIGVKGYAASDGGFNPTNALIQNFGHLAVKNVIKVNEKEAKDFASGKQLPMKIGGKPKFVVVKYNEHVIGLGYSNGTHILNRIPEKRDRMIINSIYSAPNK